MEMVLASFASLALESPARESALESRLMVNIVMLCGNRLRGRGGTRIYRSALVVKDPTSVQLRQTEGFVIGT